MNPFPIMMMFAIVVAMTIVTYMTGYHDGKVAGIAEITVIYETRKSEHDRIMQYIGVCKWSKVMAADIRCLGELP